MKKPDYSKILLFGITALIVLAVSYTYLVPSATLGDFSKFTDNSEINQPVTVAINKDREMEKTPTGEIQSFYARDKNNVELKINLHEPIPPSILDAEVIEILGHVHGTVFSASSATAIK